MPPKRVPIGKLKKSKTPSKRCCSARARGEGLQKLPRSTWKAFHNLRINPLGDTYVRR
jgi:hypothetical protein